MSTDVAEVRLAPPNNALVENLFKNSEPLTKVREVLLEKCGHFYIFGGTALLSSTDGLDLDKKGLAHIDPYDEKTNDYHRSKMADVDILVDKIDDNGELVADLQRKFGDEAQVVLMEREGDLKRIDVIQIGANGERLHMLSIADISVKDAYLRKIEGVLTGSEQEVAGDHALEHSMLRGEVLGNLCRCIEVDPNGSRLRVFEGIVAGAEIPTIRPNYQTLMTVANARELVSAGEQVAAINVVNSVVFGVGKAIYLRTLGFGLYDAGIKAEFRREIDGVLLMAARGEVELDRPRYIASKAMIKAMNTSLLHFRNGLVDTGFMKIISEKFDRELQKLMDVDSGEAARNWARMNDVLELEDIRETIPADDVFAAMMAVLMDEETATEVSTELSANWRSDYPIEDELLWGGRRIGKIDVEGSKLMEKYQQYRKMLDVGIK